MGIRSFLERFLYHVEVPRREYLPPGHILENHEIAAISCHFNPNQYRSRTQNYLEFHRRMREKTPQIRLLTIELAFGDAPFELSHLPDVIQLRTQDIMWQKERLLHLGIEALTREGYQKVAWLDGDIILEDPYWPERASKLLDEKSIIQLFSESVRLGKKNESPYARTGVVKHFLETGKIQLRGYSCGYAWAARTDLLSRVPLYDASILGGGDAANWLGALCSGDLQKWEKSIRKIKLFQSWGKGIWSHYLPWAKKFGAEVAGRVGYLEQSVSSLHHGNPKNRFYGERYSWIPEFDPVKDLKLDSSHCWSWASSQIALHAKVKEYFKRRREDE